MTGAATRRFQTRAHRFRSESRAVAGQASSSSQALILAAASTAVEGEAFMIGATAAFLAGRPPAVGIT